MAFATSTSSNEPMPNRILQGLLDLFHFGWGSAKFEVNEVGELVHTSTEVTVKMNKGEKLEAFLARLKADYDWRKGDQLEIMSNGGKYDTARIVRMPR